MSERLSTHNTANPTPTGPASMGLGADLNTYALPLASGGVAVLTQPNSSGKTIKTVTGSISANTNIVSLVAAKRIKAVAFSLLTAYSAGTITVIFTDGNGGTTLWQTLLQAISGAVSGANLATAAPSFLFGTAAGNAMYLNPGGQTVVYSLSYFDDDAT